MIGSGAAKLGGEGSIVGLLLLLFNVQITIILYAFNICALTLCRACRSCTFVNASVDQFCMVCDGAGWSCQ